ncbi:MAG: hypothetical protein ABIM89_04020 [Mycobacteriales bacterium]
MTDPFGTQEIRARVLDAWSASPTRFREDANTEEDYAHRAYADRLVYEIAQNAADAAATAGVPGRVRFVLTPQALYAANTGAPLTAAGVESLSHLRASTKAEGSVGRFGVGFKAVLAVTDAPAVMSHAGGVRWSREETAALVAAVPSLTAELRRRAGSAPVMRLPFPADEYDRSTRLLLDRGYDTVVVVPWRDDMAAALGAELVAGADPTLQLFLPGLRELVVETPDDEWSLTTDWDGERVTLGGRRWWVRSRRGDLPAELRGAQAVEDRERAGWHVGVAFAMTGEDVVPLPEEFARVLRAPQPTDEQLSVAAIVAASVPLDATRRHALSSPMTSYLLERAAALYTAMLAEAPPRPELLDLVPTGLPGGQIDAALRAGLADRLATSAFLASAGDVSVRLRPAEAAVVDAGNASDDITAVLAPLLPQLISAAHSRRHGALAALGVRRLDTADVVELLAALDQPPAWWAVAFAALGRAADRDALRALRVPLADGRLASGPRGLLLPTDGVDLRPLVDLGLAVRAVHPDAVSAESAQVLRALGAVDADAGALLDEPALRDAVESSLDDAPEVDADAVARAVLTLAAARPHAARERLWLADLALRNSDGDLQPAGELLLPASAGGRLGELMDADAPFGGVSEEHVQQFGAEALEAVGVLRTFAVVRAEDVPAESAAAALFLDGEGDWLASLDAGDGAAPPLVTEFRAIRDLEWIAADRWSDALIELASPELRPIVTEPVRLLLPDGRSADGPSYTRWWLDNHGCVPLGDGHLARPSELRSPAAPSVLAGLYDVAPELDPAAAALIAELGAVASLGQLLTAGPRPLVDLLDRLGDPVRNVARHQLRALYGPACSALAHFLDDDLPAIDSVRGVVRGEMVRAVVPTQAVIVDAPDLVGLVGDRPVVPVPLTLSSAATQVLEVPLATGLAEYAVRSTSVARCRWSQLPSYDAVIERLGLVGSTIADDVREMSYDEHDSLLCDDADGVETKVAWRLVDGRASISRDNFVHGASRALATLLGQWSQRNAVAAMLAYPDRLGELLAEAELD